MDQQQQQQQWFLGGSPAHNPTFLPPPSPQWQQQQQPRFLGPLLPPAQKQQQQQQRGAGLAEHSPWQEEFSQQQQQQPGSSTGFPGLGLSCQQQSRASAAAAAAAGSCNMGPHPNYHMNSGQLMSSPHSQLPSSPHMAPSSNNNNPDQQQQQPRSSAPIDLPLHITPNTNDMTDVSMETENMSWRPGTSLGLSLSGFGRASSLDAPLPPLTSPSAPAPLPLLLPPLPWQQQQQGLAAAAAAVCDRSGAVERTASISSLITDSPVLFGSSAAAAAAGSSRAGAGVSNLAAVLLHQHSGQQQQQQLLRRPATAGGPAPVVVPCAATGIAAAAAGGGSSSSMEALLGPAAADRFDPSLLPGPAALRRGSSTRSYSFSGGESLASPTAAAATLAAAAAAAVGGSDGGNGSSPGFAAAGSSLRQQQLQRLSPTATGSAPGSFQAPSMMIPVNNSSTRDGSPSPAAAAAAAAGSSRLAKGGVSCPSSALNLPDQEHWQQQQQRRERSQGPPSSTGTLPAGAGAGAAGSSVLPWQLQEPVFDLPHFPPGERQVITDFEGSAAAAAARNRDMTVNQQRRAQPAADEDTDMQEQQQETQRRRSSISGLAAAAAPAPQPLDDGALDQTMDDEPDQATPDHTGQIRSGAAAAAAADQTLDSNQQQLQELLQHMAGAGAAAEALDVCLNCTAPLLIDFDDEDDMLLLTHNIQNDDQDNMEGVVRAGKRPGSSSSSGVVCFSCGHRQADDRALMTGHIPAKLAAAAVGSARGCALRPSGPVILAFDEKLLLHSPPCDSSHPERPERAAAVMSRLIETGLAAQCTRVPCRVARVDELAVVHDMDLIREVQQASKLQQQEAAAAAQAAAAADQQQSLINPDQQQQQQQRYLPSAAAAADTAAGVSHGAEFGASHILDCYIGPATYDCAAMAAAAAIDAAVAVVQGNAAAAAAIIRPPGHHAEGGLAMGFCYFNNAAVAARAAQSAGASKVLILDWDVHHGNGTHAIFESDPSVMYMSLHRYDHGNFFPGTGHVEDVGTGAAAGSSVNVPWDGPGPGDADYMAAFTRVLLPIAYEFAPDLIIVSAGFDAAHGDPLGGCHVTPACFGHMTALLQPIGPLALLLEGGYNLAATAASVEACVRVLLGQPPARMQTPLVPSRVGLSAIASAVVVQGRYWRSLGGGMQGPPSELTPEQQHHHSKAVGQHPTHVPQQQHPHSQHKQQQQQQQMDGFGDPDGVWRVNSIPPPGSSRSTQQQQPPPEIQRIATPALGVPTMHANGFGPQQQQQQQQPDRRPVYGPQTPSGPPTAADAAGSSDVSDPFALQANWSFGDGPHPNTAAAAGSSGPPAGAEGGSGTGDSLLFAQLRRQLQCEGGPSLEMPLSAAPTLSSTFSM